MSDVLSLHEIANWQLAPEMGEVRAALPALQRGFVWKVRQVEELWDSIIRRFPIGAFLLSPFDEKQGKQRFKYEQKHEQVDAVTFTPTHHLLDGQQRSTAIALGFMDVWSESSDSGSALWVDIGEAPKKRDVEFIFRVLTRSHPWGYSRDDSSKILTTQYRREALEAYQQATPAYKDARVAQIPLSVVWPWDAIAPIPFAFVIAAVRESSSVEQAREYLEKQLRSLNFFVSSDKYKELVQAFDGSNQCLSNRLDTLLIRVWHVFQEKNYQIPILTLSLDEFSSKATLNLASQDKANEPAPDAVETLFVRINSSGTRLEGEELMYSLLKASWSEAPNFIDKLQHKLALPSRIAILCAGLVLARETDQTKLPPFISNVSDFRRFMHDEKYFSKMQAFIANDAVKIFEYAHSYLTGHNFALPAVLAAELAQRSPDVFFLLLRWIDRMQQEKLDMQLKTDDHKKMLGFLTAISWFAKDKTQVVSHLWPKLQEAKASDRGGIKSFFSKRNFKSAFELTNSGDYRLLPLIPPDVLRGAFENRILSGVRNYPGIKEKDSIIWTKEWNWDRWLSNTMPIPLKNWYADSYNESWKRSVNTQKELSGWYLEAWQVFINSLWDNKSILLYSQRVSLNQWFPDFDPSLPDSMEDTNRPWDYDHIHPHSYLKNHKKIPQLIKDWHGSIGNFRAWPLELNRSDGDSAPSSKLQRHEDRESSVINDEMWPFWEKSTPLEDFPHSYLADPDCHKQRAALVEAIIRRFVALYEEWYKTLKIGELTR
ncbi:DUF262 domain-containing protein [Thiothrix subterranea]|uniref:DUF262 domain-containing protein n=1 Tax=Thiothrix subterranea TaxID=2735563 RepID=UPI00192C3859|nr:DUF262 domain-containing protein [Thiothrix subterranea]QQZ30228.1 DUF262 domain-containing protein [Thiothrix subterranea]